MSGGYYNYAYRQVQEMSEALELDSSLGASRALRTAFRKHLERVADAMQACEWNDSSDGDSFEEEKILACLQPQNILESLIYSVEEAKKAAKQLARAIEKVQTLETRKDV